MPIDLTLNSLSLDIPRLAELVADVPMGTNSIKEIANRPVCSNVPLIGCTATPVAPFAQRLGLEDFLLTHLGPVNFAREFAHID